MSVVAVWLTAFLGLQCNLGSYANNKKVLDRADHASECPRSHRKPKGKEHNDKHYPVHKGQTAQENQCHGHTDRQPPDLGYRPKDPQGRP